jgi:hypothetical protein
MEQRPLRLGDLVDDYCPRERRITNHAIVAIVGDVIRQTRCTTCDAEHVFRDGKAPRRLVARKREADVPAGTPATGPLGPNAVAPAEVSLTNGRDGDEAPLPQAAGQDEAPPAADEAERAVDGWLAHRPLIRATLPRTEGSEPPARPIPEFTMHQRQARGGRAFRQAWHGGNGQPNGFRQDRQGQGGQGHGQGRHGHGKSGRHRGSNNKRSR